MDGFAGQAIGLIRPLMLSLGLFLFVLGTGMVVVRLRGLANFAKTNGCERPTSTYPHSPFLLGLDYVFSQALNIRKHRFADGVAALFRNLGPTWTARPAGKLVVHTVDPENLRALMSTRCDDWATIPAREKLVTTLYGPGLFATSGHEWRYSRALSRQALARMAYDDGVYQQHAQYLISSVEAACDGVAVDFSELTRDYSSDVAADLFFGESRHSKDPAAASRAGVLHEHFNRLVAIGRALTLFGKRIPYVIGLFYPGYKRNKGTVDSIIDGHLARDASPLSTSPVTTALDSLPQSAKVENKQPGRTTLTRAFAESTSDLRRARIELANLLLAGNDAVAIALSEMIWQLARSPAVWAKLRAEALDVLSVGGSLRGATLADVRRCEYLRCIMNEGFRLRPALSVHGRIARRDTVLPRGGGVNGRAPIVVPRGAYVVYCHYALHRDATVFGADVDNFRPERWVGEPAPSDSLSSPQVLDRSLQSVDAKQAGHTPPRRASLPLLRPDRYAFLPFGAGPRACPGEKLGSNAVALALLSFAATFERVTPAERQGDKDLWEEAMTFSFFNRHGVHVVFERGQTMAEERP